MVHWREEKNHSPNLFFWGGGGGVLTKDHLNKLSSIHCSSSSSEGSLRINDQATPPSGSGGVKALVGAGQKQQRSKYKVEQEWKKDYRDGDFRE